MKVKRENRVANLSYKVERVNGGNQRERKARKLEKEGRGKKWRENVEREMKVD